tara:strand:+ start:162 stop:338 length:177 start_codon:yes stop_codon:yes gene_type:complete
MKPIYQNPKPELKKIRESLEELAKSVTEIKNILQPESIHQIENMYPWHSTNTSADEEM